MSNNYNKPSNDFRTFLKDLKAGSINGVLVFHGQESFLINWATMELVKKYVNPGFETLDFIKISEPVDTSFIIENIETISMISERRILWLDNYRHLLDEKTKGYSQSDINALRDYLDNYSGNCIVIISFDDIDGKLSKLKLNNFKDYEFGKLDVKEFNSFVKKRLNAAGKQIGNDGLNLIADYSGYYNKESQYRLQNLENDIKKIIAHSDGDTVTTEDIEASLNGDLDTYIFNFIEALSTKQKDKSLSLMNNLLNSGTNFFQLITLISNQFELMLEILELDQQGLNLSAITKEIGMHEFRVKKAYKAAQRFSLSAIKVILINLYEIDRNVKSGNIEQRTALELFVAKI